MKNFHEAEMSVEPFQIDVTACNDGLSVSEKETGYYSVVISNQNEEQIFISQTHIKN